MANSPLKSTFTTDDILRLAKIATGSLPAAGAGNEGAIVYDDTTNTLKISNGSSWVEVSGGGGAVTGSGTANELTFWSGSSTLTSDAGMTYDIGASRLTVNGGVVADGPSTNGSQLFTINAATDTIPSDKQIVRLASTINDVVLIGTPIIAPGLYEGQRLITIVDPSSNGSISFSYGVSGGIAPIASATVLQWYNGQDYQEALEWVWVDGFWKSVSQAAQNPIKTPMDASFVSGALSNTTVNTLGLGLAGDDVRTDPGDNTQGVGSSRISIELTLNNLVFTATPTFNPPSWDSNADQEILLVRNKPNSGFTVTLQDEDLVTGSNLFLATPQCILRENEWIQLIFTNNEWHEYSRSRVHQEEVMGTVSGTITLDPRGADTVRVIVDTGGATLDTPSVTTGYGYHGLEMLVWNDPISLDDLNMDDEGTTPGTKLRLSTGSLILTPGSSVKLKFNGDDSTWYEIGRTLVV